MKKKLFLVVLLFIGFIASANTYYVSNTGEDTNPGTFSQPWRTIQHSIDMAMAGDTVYIRGGVYPEQLNFIHSGNSTDGHIVFKAYPEENPVIDGDGLGLSTGLYLKNISYVILDGLEIQYFPDNSIYDSSCSYIIFNNLKVHDFQNGIKFEGGCHHVELNNVECYRYAATGIGFGIDVSWDDVENTLPNHDFVFNYCKAHSDFNPEDNVDGFAVGHQTTFATQYNFTYNHCLAYDVYDGFDMSGTNTILNGCMAYNCHNGAYKLWNTDIHLINCIDYADNAANVELDDAILIPGHHYTVYLQNCTFYGVQNCIWVENNLQDTLVLRNCILSGATAHSIWFNLDGGFNYRGDHNIFNNQDSSTTILLGSADYTLSNWKALSSEDLHSKYVADPDILFMDTATYDLHLCENSPAIDAGSPQDAPDVDFEGYSRPYGAGYDIGAYEKNPMSAILQRTNPSTLKIIPNPVVDYTLIVLPCIQDYNIVLFDISGRTIIRKSVRNDHITHLDLSGQPEGIYFLSAVSGDGKARLNAKLVVDKSR